MNDEMKLTGYPSIDKPWLKYYSEEAIHSAVPECSAYQRVLEQLASLATLRLFGESTDQSLLT